MKQSLLFILIFFGVTTGTLQAQNFAFKYVPETNQLGIKWYTEKLTYTSGVKLYRKTNEEEWELLTPTPLYAKEYTVKAEILERDTVLAGMVDFLKEEGNTGTRDPFINLQLIMKSFGSLELSNYLGIYYLDQEIEVNNFYQYKITDAVTGKYLLISERVQPSKYIKVAPPTGFEIQKNGKSVGFNWTPETLRYFAVDVYAKYPSEQAFSKKNRLPIIVSEAENTKYYYSEPLSKEKGTFEYKLQALDFWGETSDFTETLSIQTSNIPLAIAPQELRVDTLVRETAYLSWVGFDSEELVGYKLYHKTKAAHEWTLYTDSLYRKETTKLIIENLSQGDHYFAVAAINTDELPNYSNTTLAVVEDMKAPAKVVGLTKNINDRDLQLSWAANTEGDFESYLVFRSYNNEDFLLLSVKGQVATTYSEKIDQRVKTSVWYKVAARDSSLNISEYSEVIEVVIADQFAPHVPVIKGIKTLPGNNEIRWIKNMEDDFAGYQLQRCVKSECVNLTNILLKEAFYVDSLFSSKDTLVAYQLAAVDFTGNVSPFSTPFTVKVVAKKQALENIQLQVKPKKNNYLLKWNDLSEGASVFLITENQEGETKTRITTDKNKYTLEGNYSSIYLKAYYKNGQIITSNYWLK